MSKIVVHSKPNCPYCVKAKQFLADKGIEYTVIEYDPDQPYYENTKNDLVGRTGHRTFPQIFVGPTFLGGYTELVSAYDTLRFHELCKEIGIDVEVDF